MEIINNCEITYESGEHATAVDITITRGINAYGEVKWKTIPDELQTPHKGIIIDVGSSKKDEKRKVIDWKKFEWDKYSKNSKDPLKNLAERWRSENLSVPTMSSELRQCLEGEVEGIAKKKMVSNHSKPWIDPKVSSLLKDLHEARRHSQRHRSQRNIDRYKDLLDKVSKEVEKLHNDYIISECEKLNGMKDHEKWKIINKLLNHRCNSTVQRKTNIYLKMLKYFKRWKSTTSINQIKRIVSSKSRSRNGRMRQNYPPQVV